MAATVEATRRYGILPQKHIEWYVNVYPERPQHERYGLPMGTRNTCANHRRLAEKGYIVRVKWRIADAIF